MAISNPANSQRHQAEIQAAIHEPGALRQDVTAALELAAHHEVGGFLKFHEEDPGAEGVGHATRNNEGVAGADGDGVETGLEAGDVLRRDEVAEGVACGRALEAQEDVRVGLVRPGGEHVVGLGLAGG